MSISGFSVIVHTLLLRKNKTKLDILNSNMPITFQDQSCFQALKALIQHKKV